MAPINSKLRAAAVIVCPDPLIPVVLQVAVERVGERAGAWETLPDNLKGGNDEDEALRQPEDRKDLEKESTHFHGV